MLQPHDQFGEALLLALGFSDQGGFFQQGTLWAVLDCVENTWVFSHRGNIPQKFPSPLHPTTLIRYCHKSLRVLPETDDSHPAVETCKQLLPKAIAFRQVMRLRPPRPKRPRRLP